ncbi:MAG: sulfite exporter TauE/SafE family protein [Betaproteobacteria bacterium]|nr:sulfite exporter TauE/SafE family protein [Betaproteobacteria bacterium]
MRYAVTCRYSQGAFLFAVPIGGLAGLIGLGGGEFRLPVLTQVIGFTAREAIPLNLLISLATLSFALVTRNHAVPVSGVLAHLPEVAGLLLGGTISAIFGVRFVLRMSARRLIISMAVLLAALGVLLLAEAFFPFGHTGLAAQSPYLRALAGIFVGLGVGVVSSMLGVAGGELLIPALVFIFGADIRIAGTASVLISLAIVATGLWRYHRAGALPISGGAPRIALSMSAGSLIGAVLGGMAVAVAPVALLKVVLGSVLIVAAVKTLSHRGA